MNPENAIEVHDITKNFKIFLDKGRTLKELALFSKRRRFEEREVLKGISFEVKKGEAIGLIGHNGCGKSTTLKLLTKIMYPDSGSIEMKGRVSSLIELGAGFHPDMSGRQNIYTNASIFGLTRKEIDARLNDIIAFSELEDFIDNPVRTYSSGMYMRLAFSVAINVDADILLIDEILAVGDANFQAKCFEKLIEVKSKGTTIVIVSHSMGQIEKICEKSIWINEGKIVKEGIPQNVHFEYMNYMSSKKRLYIPRQAEENKEQEEAECYRNNGIKIRSVQMAGKNCEGVQRFKSGSALDILIYYSAEHEMKDVVFSIGIFDVSGLQIFGTSKLIDCLKISANGVMSCKINELSLYEGEYKLNVAIHSPDNINYDCKENAYEFSVYKAVGEIGILYMGHIWSQNE